MSGLTIAQLKNELITHGVELPSSGSKKSEYVELYEEHVLPVQQSKGEFSSDDDEESSTPSISPQASTDLNMVVNGVDVETLNDEELFTRLQALGATCGPIVASTRTIYQKKLMKLMGGDVVDAPQYNGDVDLDEEEEYSDNEEVLVPEPVEPRQTRSAIVSDVTSRSSIGADVAGSKAQSTTTTTNYTSQYTSANSPEVRRRIPETTAAAPLSPVSTGISFDPDRHTPSPRRSLRTVTSSSSETITVRKIVNNESRIPNTYSPLRPLLGEKPQTNVRTRSSLLSEKSNVVESKSHAKLVSSLQTAAEVKEELVTEDEGSSKMALLCRLLVKLILLLVLIIALLYVYQLYQENNPENPMKALEELAKQALEAATGQEVEAGGGPVPPAALPPAAAAPPIVAPPAAAPPIVAPPAVAPPAAAVPSQ